MITTTKYVNHDGLEVDDAYDAVAMVRITKLGWLSWRWEMWDVAVTYFEASRFLKARAVLRPTRLWRHGQAPSRFQAELSARQCVIRHHFRETSDL